MTFELQWILQHIATRQAVAVQLFGAKIMQQIGAVQRIATICNNLQQAIMQQIGAVQQSLMQQIVALHQVATIMNINYNIENQKKG